VRRRLDLGDFRLGVIGITDDTMGELVPPGSVVVIDKSHNSVEMGGWKSIRERPILFRVARKRLQLLLVLHGAGNFVYRAPDFWTGFLTG